MRSIFLFLLAACLLGTGCKSNKEDQEDNTEDQVENKLDQISESAEEGAQKMKDWLNSPGDGKDVELVEIADLKALLPSTMDGLQRERLAGEGVGALGFKLHQAEAEYEKGDKRLEIHLIDFGGFGPAMVALASWTITNIYHEDEDGYEKVTEWKGYKTFEKSNLKNKSSSVSLIYKNRLIVNAEAEEMDIDDLKDLLEDEILDELNDMDIKSPKQK